MNKGLLVKESSYNVLPRYFTDDVVQGDEILARKIIDFPIIQKFFYLNKLEWQKLYITNVNESSISIWIPYTTSNRKLLWTSIDLAKSLAENCEKAAL